MILSNKWYNILKWVVTIVMPATATLIAALGAIYDWSWADNAVATIVALATFMGTILMISSSQYSKNETRAGREIVADEVRESLAGTMIVSEDPGGLTYTLQPADDDLEKLKDRDFVSFRVMRS